MKETAAERQRAAEMQQRLEKVHAASTAQLRKDKEDLREQLSALTDLQDKLAVAEAEALELRAHVKKLESDIAAQESKRL